MKLAAKPAPGGTGGRLLSLPEIEERTAVLRREIAEREEFLSHLEAVGFREKYEAKIAREVHVRKREIAALRRDFKPSGLRRLPDFEYNATRHVVQYGDNLFRSEDGEHTFEQYGHLLAHRRDFAARALDEAEQRRLRELIPHGREHSYEVYGDRYGVHAGRLEEARATQALVTRKFKEEQGRRTSALRMELQRQRGFREVQALRDAEERHEARVANAAAADAEAEEVRRVVQHRQLADELHARIETQDYRAKLHAAEKRATDAAAAEAAREAAAERRAAEAARWRAEAARREEALAAKRAEGARRRAALDAENWRDEVSDLLRSVKTLGSKYDRRAEAKARLAAAAAEARAREAEERRAMAAEEEAQRALEAERERRRLAALAGRRRPRRRRRRAKDDAGGAEEELRRRLAEAQRQKQLEMEAAMRRAILRAHARATRCRLAGAERAWAQWRACTRHAWLRERVQRWVGSALADALGAAWRKWRAWLRALAAWELERARLRREAVRGRQAAYMAGFRQACAQRDERHVLQYSWEEDGRRQHRLLGQGQGRGEGGRVRRGGGGGGGGDRTAAGRRRRKQANEPAWARFPI
eukprot:g5507.t1